MKKIITLFLVLAGFVGTVSAENVTKRIFVKTDANFQTYQGSGLAVHAWYTNNGGDLFNQGNENEKMAIFEGFNPSGANGLWFKDITFDASKTIQFFVYKYNDTGWYSSDATQKQINSSSAINYYSWNSNNNGDLTDEGTVTYYAYLYDGTSEWTQQALTTTNNATYTTTIDNQTSYNSALELIIAPSLAFEDDFSSYKWHMMFRPFGENMNVGFNNQIEYGGGCYGGSNSNSLKLNAEAKYELTFYPFEWKYSLAPSFTRTLHAEAGGYGTFSSEYDVLIPSGLTAKYCSAVNTTTGEITWVDYASTGIKGGEGALLVGVAGEEYTFTPATSAVQPGTNYLKAIGSTYKNEVLPSGNASYTNYILSKSGSTVGFFKVNSNGSWVNVGTAYLQVPNTAIREAFFFDDEFTGISATQIDNEAMVVYDLQGRHVAQPTKGLYIVNGKKVIIK